METHEKLSDLRRILRDMKSVLVAYSGGVDSTFLLKVAIEELGNDVLAVTAVSPTYTDAEHKQACEIARNLDVRHATIFTNELEVPEFVQNPTDRCYFCKKELFQILSDIAKREGVVSVADASNLDDCSDFRPGRKAARELGVRSPLVEAGLTKDDIRILSKEMDLPTWNKPSMACLASRFPYGERITAEKLDRVERAEVLLRELGFKQLRVRSHGALARIEVETDQLDRLAEPTLRQRVIEELKALGFTYITFDLEGYRTGSLNEVLQKQ